MFVIERQDGRILSKDGDFIITYFGWLMPNGRQREFSSKEEAQTVKIQLEKEFKYEFDILSI